MSTRPIPRAIENWFPTKWSEVVGNHDVKLQWKNMIQRGPMNMVISGPNGTAKSRMCQLGLRSMLCRHRIDDLDPCGVCDTCRNSSGRMASLSGVFVGIHDAACCVHMVDCLTVSAGELRVLSRDSSIEDPTTIVCLDEIDALVRRDIFNEIKNACDQSPASWIGTAISLKPRKAKARRQPIVQWPPEMNRRFGRRIGTELPNEVNLQAWILDRCREWEINLENEQVVLDIVKRSKLRVRHVLEMLAIGASNPGRTLTDSHIRSFNFVNPD